jgi:hypothetical protein
MKHVSTLTRAYKRPAVAASGLYVKEAWVDYFSGIVDLFTDFVGLLSDMRSLRD